MVIYPILVYNSVWIALCEKVHKRYNGRGI